jgi:hypothetical protein
MDKNTKILIGAGTLAFAYYLYNASKASAPVSTPIKTPVIPLATTPQSQVVATPVSQVATTPMSEIPPIGNDITGEKIIAAKKAAQDEIDRLAQIKAYEEENARQEAIRLADQKAYEEENARLEAKRLADEKAYLAELEKKRLEAEADEAARQKAMNAFMYPTCPDGFEWYQNQCLPTYVKVEEQAKKGEGLVLRDYVKNTTTLVQACPSDYIKQGINCIPRYSLSPQQLQVISMEEAGMVQTSDGQWYTSAEAAAIAQAKIDTYNSTQNSTQKYTPRQSNINIAICSIGRDGYINNPDSRSTNGMSLGKYIGEFKVTATELGIARASCPNSVYSSNLIFGGRADDETLGYK